MTLRFAKTLQRHAGDTFQQGDGIVMKPKRSDNAARTVMNPTRSRKVAAAP